MYERQDLMRVSFVNMEGHKTILKLEDMLSDFGNTAIWWFNFRSICHLKGPRRSGEVF